MIELIHSYCAFNRFDDRADPFQGLNDSEDENYDDKYVDLDNTIVALVNLCHCRNGEAMSPETMHNAVIHQTIHT